MSLPAVAAPTSVPCPGSTGTKPPVLILLPRADFDPSEVALPWQILRSRGYAVQFASPEGRAAAADPRMLSGCDLDLWRAIPLLRRLPLIGLLLRANGDARRAYVALNGAAEFRAPLAYAEIDLERCAGVLVPGGHWARGMREFLEHPRLQQLIVKAFRRDLPLAAVCHGVLLVARSLDPASGRSVLYGRRTTALTWSLERSAWRLLRYAGCFWDANYYRTYPEQAGEPWGYRSVQAEVTRLLREPGDFLDVPQDAPQAFRKRSGLFRDRAEDNRAAWVVRDRQYLSARWPGDVHLLARRFADLLDAGATAPPPLA